MIPMLARSADQDFLDAVVRYVESPLWALDPKMDGRRLLVEVDGNGRSVGFSRSGGGATLPRPLAAELERLRGMAVVIDGELMPDGRWWVFDLPSAGTHVTPASPFEWRRTVLDQVVDTWTPDPAVVRLVPWASTQPDKALLAHHVIEQHGEGLMAKRLDGVYQPGKRSRNVLKIKHVKEASFVVTGFGIDGRDNIQLSVWRDGVLVPVGEVAAFTGTGPDAVAAGVGCVVDVTFLYVSRDGRLVQPVKPRLRTDVDAAECTWERLAPFIVNREAFA